MYNYSVIILGVVYVFFNESSLGLVFYLYSTRTYPVGTDHEHERAHGTHARCLLSPETYVVADSGNKIDLLYSCN